MNLFLLAGIILTSIILILLLLWKFYFLRNPKPNIPEQENTIISPAEGIIARIIHFKQGKEQTVEKGLFGKIQLITKDVAKEGYLILIRLHIYNVHYQRAPIAGTVEKINYTYGKFLNAVKNPESMQCFFQNEHNEIIIKGKIKCKVIQIAGYLARRIECFVKEKNKVEKGQEIGLINLGSQVALIIPKCKLIVDEGEKIKIAQTIGLYK
ncbi:hypothetical protein COV16_04940 [Candidatus Woesearchaeota archaeon CG10_big_fil_rev_8_21_14_0_10_34_8]|nr:MAG: hypothetical protein COV16_04940 [Candidatus Woesearchaeota archaeon CG10_big_fil_rev_8_21_14_0_10_34_8]